MFSILKHDVPVGKLMTLNQDGTLNSETNGRLESALSTLHSITHPHELRSIIESATGYEHIVCGVSGHTSPIGVYPGAKVEGSIARDNKHYKFPKGQGLLCIDSDNITESIYPSLVDICQQMGAVPCIETTSSSSNIYVANRWLRGFTGTHTFFIVKDGRDIKRTLNVLHKRAILKGYGMHRVSAVGGFLERSFIDTMLDKPSQPIYLKPNLEDGIFQDKKIVEYAGSGVSGDVVLDTRKFVVNLSEAEEVEYDAIVNCDRMMMQAEMAKVREQWLSTQPDRKSAEKALSTKVLDGPFVIHTAHQGTVTVHDLLMEPGRFNRQTCRDPFDTENGSKTKAMIFTDQSRAMINTHSHGGSVYQLLDPTMVGFGVERVPVSDLYPNARFGELALPGVEVAVGGDSVMSTDIAIPDQNYNCIDPIDSNLWIGPHCNSQGKPRTTYDIFEFMVRQYGILIGYDVIGKTTLMLGQHMIVEGDMKAEANHGVIHHLCKLNQLEVGSIDRYIARLMMVNQVNPVTNWVGSVAWDGTSRIRALFDTLNVVENDMSFILFVKWCMGALRLGKGYIERFEHVLVLQASEGGEGKSRWFNKLTPPELNNSMSLRLDDKDQLKEAVSYWIVELGELDSTFNKSDIKHLMGFLSKRKDNIRLPYGKTSSEFQRHTAYAGTVNGKNFLIDDSGDRRFWILETGDINYDHNVNVQQFWAEIDTLDGQEWLTREENSQIIDINKNYKMEDPISDMLESYFSRSIVREGKQHINTTQILKNIGIINPTKAQLNKAGRWLRDKRYKPSNKRVNGHQVKGYDIPIFNEMLL